FFLASVLGTAGWTALLAGAGYKLGENFAGINAVLGPASNAILITLAVGYLWRVWTHRNYRPPSEK
ncbi:MAG TPA: DedA family protein, partial [Sphingomicrobium sp.]|nr:DedA family protein [Sphingomicrobium sp.]